MEVVAAAVVVVARILQVAAVMKKLRNPRKAAQAVDIMSIPSSNPIQRDRNRL